MNSNFLFAEDKLYMTSELIEMVAVNCGYMYFSRNLLNRLIASKAIDFPNINDGTKGSKNFYTGKTLREILAIMLASNCLVGFSPTSRLPNKNLYFAVAKDVIDSYESKYMQEDLLVETFVERLPYDYDLVRYIEESNGIRNELDFKVAWKVCIACYYFQKIIDGSIRTRLFSNTKAFKKATGEMADESRIIYGQGLGSFLPHNYAFIAERTDIIERDFGGNAFIFKGMYKLQERLESIGRVLKALESADMDFAQEIDAWMQFIYNHDTVKAWLSGGVALEPLQEMGVDLKGQGVRSGEMLRLVAEMAVNSIALEM